MESLDCEVSEASDAQDGIDSFRNNPTDLVVTDIFMPGDSGLRVIIDLLKEFPGTKIVAISGFEADYIDSLQAAKDFGAMHCLKKPVSVEDMKRIVY